MTILKELADARMRTYDILQRKLLSDAQEEVAGRLIILNNMPTDKNMRDLVGAWTRASILLEKHQSPGGGGGGARKRVAA